MAKYRVLYNPLSGKVTKDAVETKLKSMLDGDELEFTDVTELDSYAEVISDLKSGDRLLLVGGDGTLNRFVNSVVCEELKNDVYYYAAGSGNDFWKDIGKNVGDAPVRINEYLVNLPTVTVNGKNYKVLNGVGYGIDGYCCEVGDKLKAAGKKVNYTSIAIKGLLFHHKPSLATVTVDGEEKTFKKVWIAPTMNGRFYGGGMMCVPDQDRLNKEHKISVCLMYGKGRLGTLMVFPSIFKGEHIKKKSVAVMSGKVITVKFDKPCALQIDGETILGVTEYTVTSSAAASEEIAA